MTVCTLDHRRLPVRHVRQPVRQEVRSLVGAVLRADERARPALHRERRLRPAPVARRHRRQPGARRACWRRRASSPPTTWRAIERGLAQIAAEIESGALRVEARARGRAPQHRGAPDRSSSATPASGCTPAARATTRSRPTCACGCATRSTAIGALLAELQRALVELAERAHRDHPARLHPPAGGAAGVVRRTTCWPTSRCSRATPSAWPRCARRTNRLPLGAAALAGTSYPLDRETRRQGARHGRRLPQQHRRGQRPRLRDRVHAPRRRCAWCTSRASARSWCCG